MNTVVFFFLISQFEGARQIMTRRNGSKNAPHCGDRSLVTLCHWSGGRKLYSASAQYFFYSVCDHNLCIVLPALRFGLPPLVKPLWKHLDRFSRSCVSCLIIINQAGNGDNHTELKMRNYKKQNKTYFIKMTIV